MDSYTGHKIREYRFFRAQCSSKHLLSFTAVGGIVMYAAYRRIIGQPGFKGVVLGFPASPAIKPAKHGKKSCILAPQFPAKIGLKRVEVGDFIAGQGRYHQFLLNGSRLDGSYLRRHRTFGRGKRRRSSCNGREKRDRTRPELTSHSCTRLSRYAPHHSIAPRCLANPWSSQLRAQRGFDDTRTRSGKA